MTKQQFKEYNILLKETKNIENQLRDNDYSKNINNYFSLLRRLSLIRDDINIISQQEKTIKKPYNILTKSEPFLEGLWFYR